MAESKETPKKIFTSEEIKQICPGYRGRPEKFDPTKVGSKIRQLKNLKAKRGPSSDAPPQPSVIDRPQKPTPQQNDSMIAESIFGVDISVAPIDPRQNFSANYSQLPNLSLETFANFEPDVKQLERTIVKEEFCYYTTGLLWLKILDVKAKQGRQSLSSAEKDIRKETQDIEWNVPQPIYAYLSQIGNVTDIMGKEAELELPALPTFQAEGKGGYHAIAINQDSHNLFEEVPSLGVAGDIVMSLAANADPIPAFGFAVPAGSKINENLTGYKAIIPKPRAEIKQRLARQGITTTTFPEFVAGTRFNVKYMQSISDIIGQFQTFRNEKVVFPRLTLAGGKSQIIETKPIEGNTAKRWTECEVQANSAIRDSTAQIGASYVFGFQLYKEQGEGADDTERSARWSCVERSAAAQAQWDIPAAWLANRNERRNLPPGIGTPGFYGSVKRQDSMRYSTVRRMIKTPR